MIHKDNGKTGNMQMYGVPQPYWNDVQIAENAIRDLHVTDRVNLCIGEHEDMLEIANRTVELGVAYRLLALFFNGWHSC